MSAEEITESSKKTAPVREVNVEKNKRGRPTKKVEVVPTAAPVVSEAVATKVTKVTHPTYTQMIINGIRALNETSGSSRQAILKYIIATYGLQPQLASIRTRAVLRKALTSGLLKYGKTNGCFKVGDEEKRKIEKLEKAKSKKPRTAAESVVAIQPGSVSKQTKKPKKETKAKETKAKETKAKEIKAKETKDKETKAAKPSAAKSPAKKQRGRPAKTEGTEAADKVESPTKVQKAAPVEKPTNKVAKATKNVEKRKTKEETVESPTKKVKIGVQKRLSITRNASAVATKKAVKTKSTKKSTKTKSAAASSA